METIVKNAPRFGPERFGQMPPSPITPEDAVLSHDQERQLELIGAQLSIEDPRFAECFTAGRPRRPRQYRAWLPLVELVISILAITGAALLGPGPAVGAGAGSVAVLGLLWARRRLRLDRPPTFGRRC